MSEHIAYNDNKREGEDPWQFPDETLAVKSGDCKDRAFLIASLLLGSGISNFNVRVALGKVRTETTSGEPQTYDHMWVMYKDESGHWIVIEPLCLRAHTLKVDGAPKGNADRLIARYTPHFLFNDQHLWNIPDNRQGASFKDLVHLRRNWKKWEPRFAGAVHQTIIQQALKDLPPAQHYVIDSLNRKFHRVIFGIAGPVVDDIDRDLKTYSPIDHFDNAFIPEGWANVKARLALFHTDNHDLDSFFHAAHAIADFYAHTSYVYFQKDISAPDAVPIFDPEAALPFVPAYDADPFNLDSGKFSVNDHYWKNQPETRAACWAGKLISGRYAQVSDTQPGITNLLIEGRTNIPEALQDQADFYKRGALPHHNEIAVDEEKFNSKHKLFTKDQYALQFAARKSCAIRHVKKAFFENWKG